MWQFEPLDPANAVVTMYDVAMNTISGADGRSVNLDVTAFNVADQEQYRLGVAGQSVNCGWWVRVTRQSVCLSLKIVLKFFSILIVIFCLLNYIK